MATNVYPQTLKSTVTLTINISNCYTHPTRHSNQKKKKHSLAIKSKGRFSGRARELISPMLGLNSKSRPPMSGKASPERMVDGA